MQEESQDVAFASSGLQPLRPPQEQQLPPLSLSPLLPAYAGQAVQAAREEQEAESQEEEHQVSSKAVAVSKEGFNEG